MKVKNIITIGNTENIKEILDYNNIEAAIKSTMAKAVDVSSGVEVRKGIKSTELIKKFCNKINNI